MDEYWFILIVGLVIFVVIIYLVQTDNDLIIKISSPREWSNDNMYRTIDGENNVYGTSESKEEKTEYLSLSVDGGKDNIYGTSVSSDPDGNVYAAGFKIGTESLTLLKYNSNGDLLCSFGKNRNGRAYDLAVSKNKEVYVVGSTDNPGNDDLLLRKYDSKCNLLWERVWKANTAVSRGSGVSVSRFGDVYIIGSTGLGNSEDLLLLKYDSDGNLLWEKTQSGF